MSLYGALDKTKHFDEFNDPLQTNEGWLTPAQRKAEALANLGAASAVALEAITALTDNSAGTANDTIAAIPDPADTPASADALRDDIVANTLPAVRNAIADLAAKINAVIAALS